MREEYRNALKQLNNLDEYDMKKVIQSYAKLEVRVKDEMFGIENDDNDVKDDDFCLNSEIRYRKIQKY